MTAAVIDHTTGLDPDIDTEPDTTTSTLEARATAILETIGLAIARMIVFAMYVGIAELIRLAWHTARAVFAL
jgi:hypothetical protein